VPVEAALDDFDQLICLSAGIGVGSAAIGASKIFVS
jgi:hypothetical protein